MPEMYKILKNTTTQLSKVKYFIQSTLSQEPDTNSSPKAKHNIYLSFLSKGRLHARAIFVAIFLILTHAIEWLSHKSIDLYSFAQMVQYIRESINLIACIKRKKIAAKIACVNGPLY